jgi:hypothetical protein
MAERWLPGMMAWGLLAFPVLAGGAEDDLAVVKKAVGLEAPAPGKDASARSRAPQPARGDAARWLKLRVEERGEKKARVSINLPLDLVRALDEEGEELAPSPRREKGKGGGLRLGDVLRALRAGQEILEIEDEEATVRIWVE